MILFLLLALVAPECHPLDHNHILGSDLAAASALFAALPPGLMVGNAPRPGVRREFLPADLVRIARANQLEVSGVVPLCFERRVVPLDPELVKIVMRKSLGDENIGVEILAMSPSSVPQGQLSFPGNSLMRPVSGNSAAWNGYVAYDGGHYPVWANVRLTKLQSRLISLVDMKPGHVIESGDVRVEEASEFPRHVAPLTTTEAAIGLKSRSTLPAGSVLTAAMFEQPNDVERGESVIVEVHSGGAVVKLEAKAESTGRRGDTVAVRNASNKTLFRAQVVGKGRVLVKCPSVSEVSQ